MKEGNLEYNTLISPNKQIHFRSLPYFYSCVFEWNANEIISEWPKNMNKKRIKNQNILWFDQKAVELVTRLFFSLAINDYKFILSSRSFLLLSDLIIKYKNTFHDRCQMHDIKCTTISSLLHWVFMNWMASW